MPSPAQTPTRHAQRHSRNPSSLDLSSPMTPTRRRSSLTNPNYSPVTPRSANRQSFGEPNGGGEGLGSLADELADAWDDEDEGLPRESGGLNLEAELNGDIEVDSSYAEHQEEPGVNGAPIHTGRDSGIALDSSPAIPSIPPNHFDHNSLSPQRVNSKYRRKRSYDGSDYGDEDDFESDGISPGLERRMAEVESLARRGLEENGSESDKVVSRFAERLGDLGGQAGVEGGVTRLTTAHTSISSHLSHQTRLLSSLASTLLSPLNIQFGFTLSPDEVDEILPLLITTQQTLPYPSSNTLHTLLSLSQSTNDLLSTLSLLGDTLQLSKQTTNLASRRLRTVKEALAEWRREEERREEGVRWIDKGNWNSRLEGREAERMCRGIVGGFEEVCEGWRRRLLEAQVEA